MRSEELGMRKEELGIIKGGLRADARRPLFMMRCRI